MECGVWSVECGVWSVECGVWRVECGVWSVECGVNWRKLPVSLQISYVFFTSCRVPHPYHICYELIFDFLIFINLLYLSLISYIKTLYSFIAVTDNRLLLFSNF